MRTHLQPLKFLKLLINTDTNANVIPYNLTFFCPTRNKPFKIFCTILS